MGDLEVSLVTADDQAKLVSNPASDEDQDLDDLKDLELPPHCMGHHFHWAEIFFVLTLVCGFVFLCIGGVITKGPDMATTITYIVYCAAAATAAALMWNLISIKRIAAASEMLLEDVKKFRAQNSRAKELQQKNKENDVKMKQNLADLEKAGLLLKGSVQGLEDVQKQEEEMLEERQKLLEDRREVAAKLEENMNKLWELTIDAVRSELEKRVFDVFQDLAKPHPNGSDDEGIVVFSEDWHELISIIDEYGVHIDENDKSEFGLLTMAGEDKFLNMDEFEQFWKHADQVHFTNLIAILRRNRELEDRIRSLELGLPEKETEKSDEVIISV